MPAQFLLEGAVAHAARGRDGRQEGRECGYYYLHRHLNDTLLHSFSLITNHYSLAQRLVLVEVIATVTTRATRVDHEA